MNTSLISPWTPTPESYELHHKSNYNYTFLVGTLYPLATQSDYEQKVLSPNPALAILAP